ncbi:MAG: class I SAM-dependent methyltransferase [Lachnospiraceae bacterium]|nr:class I SAM-dependent methyltransferase [Lachnospiraceae bacterium]
MKKVKSNMRDFKFDKRASVYDTHIEGRLSEKAYHLVTDNIKINSDDKVLDVGCGTGTVLKRLNDICNIKGFGIDIEEKMVEQAKSKLPQMDIQKCDCSNTSFENEMFDSVIACMTFHHFYDQMAFAKEMSRVLKKGGKLYIVDPKLPNLLRKIVNTILISHSIAGKFNTNQEVSSIFKPYGLVNCEERKSGIFQLIILKKV